jgi:hypothetical protein
MCALIARGRSRCAICAGILEEGQALFATSGVFLPKADPLWKYCDAGLHWDCYAFWGERPRFARAYFQMWVDGEKSDLYWGKAYLNDALLVTVNPQPPVEEIHLHLADTGTRHFVKLKDWAGWIASEAWSLEAEHAVVRAAFKPLFPILRQRFPTSDDLLRAVDWAAKAPMIAEVKARQERLALKKEQERKLALEKVAVNNEAIARLHPELMQGKRPCPGCARQGTDFILKDGGAERKSFLVCPGCGRSFWPEDFPH